VAAVPQHTKMVSVFSDSVLFHTKLCNYWPLSWNCKHYRETLCIFEVRFAKFLNRRANNLPYEQRLHFRAMSWRAKSSPCRQPFNFLSCMRKIRHAIRNSLASNWFVKFAWVSRESNLRKLPANNSPRVFVLFFCFAPSGFKYLSRKISTDRLF